MMRKTLKFSIFVIALVFTGACSNTSEPYDLKKLDSGDLWIDKIDPDQQLQNCYVHEDRLYGNTVNPGGATYLFCLNLKNGKVNWRTPVRAYATQTVTEHDDTVFYCSYLGDMYAFDIKGGLIWKEKYTRPYAFHWVDTSTSRIYFNTVSGDKTSTYVLNGGLYKERESNTLKWKITKQAKKITPVNKKFTFNRGGWKYSIIISTPNKAEWHKIKVKKYR